MIKLAIKTGLCIWSRLVLMTLISLSIACIPAGIILTDAIQRLVFEQQWLPLVLSAFGAAAWFSISVDMFVDSWHAIVAARERYEMATARRDARRRINLLLNAQVSHESAARLFSKVRERYEMASARCDANPYLLTKSMRLPKDTLQ
jgi:hypothetical protein